ncbi:MAG: CBS domain-containing protein, partial [Burkholderiales bacterium]
MTRQMGRCRAAGNGGTLANCAISWHSNGLGKRERESPMDVAHVLTRRASSEVVTCDADMPMRAALSILANRRIGAMPVMRHGEVTGIFSERDVIYCLEREGEASLDKPVGEVMTAPAITIEPTTRIE